MSRGDNKDFIRDLKRVAPDKGSVKGLGDAVGNPDDWDKQNITNLINTFKRKKFIVEGHTVTGATVITMCREEAKMNHGVSALNPFNVKSKDLDARAVTSIPQALYMELEETMPTIFRDKKHFEWFLRNFGKQFMIPERY